MENAALHSWMGYSRLFQDLKAAFPKVTGLSLKIVSALAGLAAVQEDPDPHPFCKTVIGSPQGCAVCQQALGQLRRCGGDPPCPCEVPCLGGLTELGVPMIVEGTHVATLVVGPVLTARPQPQALNAVASELQLSVGNSAWANVERDYHQIPVLTAEQRSGVVQIMTVFARQLVTSTVPEKVPSPGRYEPPCVVYAKRYAEQHLQEHLRTRQVAGAVHVSLQHFCRSFRLATGKTFTDYLACQRVERAKQLLTNSQLSISEVAFGSGFRSLTWFDQIFKRHTGQTPRQFRAGLKIFRS